MKIQQLQPMSVQKYVSCFLPFAAKPAHYPHPMELFAPTIEAVKKLAFAPYFWFVVDYTSMAVINIDSNIVNHVQHGEKEWLSNGPEITKKMIHPEDVDMVTAYNHFQETYLGTIAPEKRRHLKFNTFFRVLDLQNNYRWYMVQMPDYYFDENGKIIYSLRVSYDISHIKKDGVAMMTLLDDSDPTNQIFLCQSNNQHQELIEKLIQLTDREMEVAKLVSTGHMSKQIAGALNISPFTVENHKKNIFRKTNTRSVNELVAFAIRSGIA